MDDRGAVKRIRVVVLGVALAWAGWLLGNGVERGGETGVEESVGSFRREAPPQLVAAVRPARQTPAHEHAHEHEHEHERHPHPITAEHRELQRERQLIAALNDALDRQDAPALRELVAHYAEHEPHDTHALQQGYLHIAECLEHPGQVSTEAAQAYYDRERASVLRRYIRRACLE